MYVFRWEKKEQTKKKKPYLRRTWHREIDTFDLIFIGERAENAIFQNGQTDKNREFERGRSMELKSSTPRPPIWIIYLSKISLK